MNKMNKFINKFIEHVAYPIGYYGLGYTSAFGLGLNIAMAHPMVDRCSKHKIEEFVNTFSYIGGAAGLIAGGYVGHLGILYGVFTITSYQKLKNHKLK